MQKFSEKVAKIHQKRLNFDKTRLKTLRGIYPRAQLMDQHKI